MSSDGFAGALKRWFRSNHRKLPWRQTSDPYHIWVSEIMLQQTRTQAAIPYYERFLERFPTVQALAAAPETEVLATWSGLGYYSRARNLLRAARIIAKQDAFPSDYDSIRRLPGIGDYTAAAVVSIAFGLPHPAVDGNVLRVMARLGNDPAEIGSSRARARFRDAVLELLDTSEPGLFNQAMMELGATVCLPKQPACPLCPVEAFCAARAAGTEQQLPIKLRKAEPVEIRMTLAVVTRGSRVLMWQRGPEAKRMAGFWELPEPNQLPGFEALERLGLFRHTITHHHYRVTVVTGTASRLPPGMEWIEPASGKPLSTMVHKALALLAARA